MILGGLQNQKRPIPHDRALQNEQKNVLHQSPNFPRSKDIGDFVVKKRWKIGNFPTICIIYAKLKHFFDHKVAFQALQFCLKMLKIANYLK